MFPNFHDNPENTAATFVEIADSELRAAGVTPNPEEMQSQVRMGGIGRTTIDISHPIIEKVRLVRTARTWRARVDQVIESKRHMDPVFEETQPLRALRNRDDIEIVDYEGNPYQYEAKTQDGFNALVQAIRA